MPVTLDVFRGRHMVYKAMLLLGFPLGLGFFVAGLASRRWTYTMTSTSQYERGLWEACEFTSYYTCYSVIGSSQYAKVPDWFVAVQVLQSLALAGILIGLVLLVVVNCFQAGTVLNRSAEVVTLVADILGLVGSVVYAARSYQDYSYVQDLHFYLKLQFVSVSYALDLAGLLVLFFAISLVALFDNPKTYGAPGRSRLQPPGRTVSEAGSPTPRTSRPATRPYPIQSYPGSVVPNNYSFDAAAAGSQDTDYVYLT